MKAKVLNSQGKAVKDLDLAAEVFGLEPNDQLLAFRGQKAFSRDIVSASLKGFGLEPIIHRPPDNPSDFPVNGKQCAILVGGSSFNIFDKDLKSNEWMRRLLDNIQDMHGKVPILGLCYGHQAVARAFGAPIERYGEIGYVAGFCPIKLEETALGDPLFKGFPRRFYALFSHFDFIPELCPDGTVLARPCDSRDRSIDSFRVGETTWGVQFHPELPDESVRSIIITKREMLENIGVDVQTMLESFNLRQRHDVRVIGNFVSFARGKL